jgi:tetratricopeptide (TPR) repeat protein
MGSVSSGRESPLPSESSHARTAGAFVGREVELEELQAGLEDALSGRGRLFLLGGEPGIGKSRLADELSDQAVRRGAKVLWGRCWEAGGAPAYWPWVQTLRSYFRDCDPQVLHGQLGGGASDLMPLFPELRQIVIDLPEPSGPADSEAGRFRLFDSICTFLKNASESQPLVFVLDDLHAADTPSLLLLEFLAGELAETHLLLVGAYRDDDLGPDHPMGGALVDLGRHRVTRHIRLVGLNESDVATFLQVATARVPPTKVVKAVYQETEGNPLFVGEVIRLLASEGRLERAGDVDAFTLSIPQGVREVIGARLGHLSPECRRVLSLASVLGREFAIDALESMSELGRDRLLEVLGEASVARVVTDSPGSLRQQRFAHALIRDALYEGLGAPERIRLHRRAGQVLEVLHAKAAEPHLAELALHFFEAAKDGDVEKAVEYARRAGDRTASLLAYEEAVRLYGMALEALEVLRPADGARCDLLLAMGDAQARAGDQSAARETFLAAADLATELALPEHLARAAIGYGGRFVWARAYFDDRLIPLLESALDASGEEDSVLRARLLARLSGALRDRPPEGMAATVSERAVEIARRLGDPATLAYALEARWASLWLPENPEERLAIATEILQVAREVGDAERIAQGYDFRICSLLELGRIGAVDQEIEAMARLVDRLRQPAQLWILTHTRAMRALLSGNFEDAEGLIEEAFRFGERAQGSDALITYRLQTFQLRMEQGRLPELEQPIRASVAEYPTRPMFRCVLAHLYAEIGREAEARRTLEAFTTGNLSELLRNNDWLLGMSHLPEVVDFLQDREWAARLYDLLLPFEERVCAHAVEISTGSVARSLGLLASTMSRWDRAVPHFEYALELNAKMGALPWVAHTQHGYARMLVARDLPGDRERADELLTEASATCRKLGMVALGEKVSALLERAGGGIGGSAESASANPPPAASIRSSVFRREGEYWSISYEGDTFRLKDSKGLRYLARLLADPGREFHVMDLAGGLGGSRGKAPRSRKATRRPDDLHLASEDAGSILDPQAKAAYRSRLSDLEDELAEAEAWDDAERAARVEEERDFLVRELAGAVGLGGRDRKAASVSEQTRVNVTKAIRSALSRIRRDGRALGLHLDRTVRTGTFCSYVPDPRSPIPWQL